VDFNILPATSRLPTWLRPQSEQEPGAGAAYPGMSRVLEDMLMTLTLGPWANRSPQRIPLAGTEVSATDEEVSIVAELPGVAAQDVEVSRDDDVLTIRIAKPQTVQDKVCSIPIRTSAALTPSAPAEGGAVPAGASPGLLNQ
jgi:HSP20 family molecular chaperone IbpA